MVWFPADVWLLLSYGQPDKPCGYLDQEEKSSNHTDTPKPSQHLPHSKDSACIHSTYRGFTRFRGFGLAIRSRTDHGERQGGQ